ncbi:MAG: nucleotidyltransferase domain-containing protein [Gammaproteobacteria bacterium]|nr:nucleotidyltransferase domain-containing protein [Gammaproteobacteria bacterium]
MPLELDIVRRLQDWATSKPEIRSLWLFGSRVRGTPRSDSDLDIAYLATDGVDDVTAALAREQEWTAEIASWCPYRPHIQPYGSLHVKDAVDDHGHLIYIHMGPKVWDTDRLGR